MTMLNVSLRLKWPGFNGLQIDMLNTQNSWFTNEEWGDIVGFYGGMEWGYNKEQSHNLFIAYSHILVSVLHGTGTTISNYHIL